MGESAWMHLYTRAQGPCCPTSAVHESGCQLSGCKFADDHDATGGIDDDTVVVEDENEPEEEDSDAVMVDALEALRLASHMQPAQSITLTRTCGRRPPQAAGIAQMMAALSMGVTA